MSQPTSAVCRVVVIDDYTDNAEAIRFFVTMTGHEAMTVPIRDAGSLMEAVLRHQPDVGLFDLSLGCADARDVARSLRASGCTAYLIAMTGYELDPAESLAAGFDQHWTKPIDLETLEQVLRERARGERPSNAERAAP